MTVVQVLGPTSPGHKEQSPVALTSGVPDPSLTPIQFLYQQGLQDEVRTPFLREAITKKKRLNYGTRRCGPLRGPSSSSCGGLWPRPRPFCCAWGKKKSFWYIYFGPKLGHFLVISSDLSNV